MKKIPIIIFFLVCYISFGFSLRPSGILALASATDCLNGYQAASAVVTKEYKTKTGKIITVAESHPMGASLSNITVAFKGDAKSKLEYIDADPINSVLVADLDGNGFDELYITTTAAGSGSYGNIIAIASNNDKSLLKIFVPTLEDKDMNRGGTFEGYEGHDTFLIKGNTLERSYPVKLPEPATRTLVYKLKAGEGGFALFIYGK